MIYGFRGRVVLRVQWKNTSKIKSEMNFFKKTQKTASFFFVFLFFLFFLFFFWQGGCWCLFSFLFSFAHGDGWKRAWVKNEGAPKEVGPEGGGAPNPEKVRTKKGWGTQGWGTQGGGPRPNIFFLSRAINAILVTLLWGSFCGIGFFLSLLNRRGLKNARLEFSGSSCANPGGPGL